MKRLAHVFMLWTVLPLAVLYPALCDGASSKLRLEGVLTDSTGALLPTGTYSLTFRIYLSQTVATPYWSETQTAVNVTNGVFSVALGSVTAIPTTLLRHEKPTLPSQMGLFASTKRYLEIIWNDPTHGPTPLGARQPITTSSYAANADTLDSLDSTHIAMKTHTHTASQVTGALTEAQVPSTITRDTEVMGIVKGADGTGSGLDADLLDGKHAAEFAASSHPHDGAHITTGTVAEARISSTITRNSQLAGYYTKAEVDTFLAALQSQITRQQDQIAALQATVNNLNNVFQGNVSRNGDNITFSGVNVRVVSGSGATDGAVNGRGNLIVGYNEPRTSGNDRSGSHNLIVGTRQNYSSYGGLVGGSYNAVTGPYASVSGGAGTTRPAG